MHRSLRKIAKGAFSVFLGSIISGVFAFIIQICVVRSLTQTDYGVFSLVLSISGIAVSLAMIGLPQGVTKFIAYHRAQKNSEKILGTVKASLEITGITGIAFFLIIFFGANFLARIFGNGALVLPLKIYSIAVPFLVFARLAVYIFRGFGRADIKVLFEQILSNVILLASLGLLFLLGFSLLRVVYVHLITAIIIFVLIVLYSWRKYFRLAKKHAALSMRKNLLLFSAPLIFRKFLANIISRSDSLMLGYFKNTAVVGMYNVALPLANYIPLFLTSANFLYLPMATQLYANKQITAFKRMYIVITKWLFAAALPIFLILFLFPQVILKFFFGAEYVAGSTVLMILSVGFVFSIFLGPNVQVLLVLGKPGFLMWTSLAAAISNIILNLILIPVYGPVGAAIASGIALAITNIVVSIKVYFISGIHPFTKNYVKPIIVSLITIIIIYGVTTTFLTITFWMLPFLFFIFIAIYSFALLFTKSFDKEDIIFLLAIEKKTGMNFGVIKKILKKFL